MFDESNQAEFLFYLAKLNYSAEEIAETKNALLDGAKFLSENNFKGSDKLIKVTVLMDNLLDSQVYKRN